MTDALSLLLPLLAAAGCVAGLWLLVGRAVGAGALRRRTLQLWAALPVIALGLAAIVGFALSVTNAREPVTRAVEATWSGLPETGWLALGLVWIALHAGLLLAGLRRTGAERGLAWAGSGLTVVADLLAFAMLGVVTARALLVQGQLV